MRIPQYLSPSALNTYKKDPVEYYRKYCCEYRAPRIPQTPAMAVGSAFDAFVKAYLHEKLIGEVDEKYDLQKLFDAQVETQNRQVVWEYGSYLFDQYQKSGALADLMMELSRSVDKPRFELDLQGSVSVHQDGLAQDLSVESNPSGTENVTREPFKRRIHDVVLLGKPDLRFLNEEGADVIEDFKVNGFLSKTPVSPMQGYVMDRIFDGSHWQRYGCHKDALCSPFKGVLINHAVKLETVNPEWAGQLATYSWLLGAEVGKEIIAGIEQVCGNKANLRITSHRLKIGRDFQFKLFEEYNYLWNILHDVHDVKDPITGKTQPMIYFFRDKPFDKSIAQQKLLEDEVRLMTQTTDSTAAAIMGWARSQ